MSARADLVRLAEQLNEERSAARPIVASIRERLPLTWDDEVPASWRSIGVVRELASESGRVLEQNPAAARELAQFAVAVATAIPADAYPVTVRAQAEGEAWRALGTAHRYLSAYDAALRAFDAAERALSAAGALAYDEALVGFARAIALSDMGRHDDAIAAANAAREVFEGFGDERRTLQCTIVRGMTYWRCGDFKRARSVYEEALAAIRNIDDLHTLAIIHGGLGQISVDLGDYTRAVEHLIQSREIVIGLDMPGEALRMDWALGRLRSKQNDHAGAVQILSDVRKRFLALNMVEEAGLTALDAVDALVALDDRAAAIALTESVIAEFRQASLNERALIALAYLRDLLPTHAAPSRPIHHVRSYIEALRSEPARLFLPLE